MNRAIGIIFFVFSTAAFGQTINYGGLQQLSLSVGERSNNLGFVMVNGLRFNRFFVGLGADIQFVSRNYYYGNAFSSSALFCDGRYYINKQKNFFAKLDGGLNMIAQNLAHSNTASYKRLPGGFGSVGLGFKARMGKEIFYSFDISYSIRQTRYDYRYMGYNPNGWRTESYNVQRSLITVNMGLEIF